MVIAVLAAALATAEPAPSSVSLAAPQVLAAAVQLQEAGEIEQALILLEGLSSDPDVEVRSEALARRALLLDRRGRPKEAAALMRRAVDLHPRAGVARMGLARLLDKAGDLDGARRQLRAAQAAGLPKPMAMAAQRYANALRERAPYGWSIELSLAPDSNINRATRSATLDTVIGEFDLDREAKARSGLGMSARGAAFARLGLSPSLRWRARVEGGQDRYRDRRFTRTTLGAATGPEVAIGSTRLEAEFGIGQASVGGQVYQRWTQLSARGFRPLGRRSAVSVALSTATVDNRFNDLQDGRSTSASLGMERALAANAGLSFQLSANRFDAKDPGYATRSAEVGLGGWLDLGQFTLSASAAKGRLAADERLLLFPERRRDSTSRVGLGVSARQLQVQTFTPFVRLSVERNASSVEIWDYRRRRFEFGLQRAF